MVGGDRPGIGRLRQCLPHLDVCATPPIGQMGTFPPHSALLKSRRLVILRRARFVRHAIVRRVPRQK